jgi:molybdopterin converting factor small subunit
MTVFVRLFGPQAVAAGTRRLAVEVPVGATARDIRTRLGELNAGLAPSLPYSRIALNFEFVGDDATVSEGDEVALIGMLSGG